MRSSRQRLSPSKTRTHKSRPRLHPAEANSSSPKPRRRSPVGLFLILLLWSLILGWGLAQATPAPVWTIAQTAQTTTPLEDSVDPDGLVDVVPENLQLGQSLYLENCATCHVAMPPAVMPTESWRKILTEPAHYGVQIQPFQEPSIYIVWNYVSTFSRPLKEEEPVPFRLRSSRYFKILHPKVEFSTPVNVRSCTTCHPNAAQFNYRTLTSEWDDSP